MAKASREEIRITTVAGSLLRSREEPKESRVGGHNGRHLGLNSRYFLLLNVSLCIGISDEIEVAKIAIDETTI